MNINNSGVNYIEPKYYEIILDRLKNAKGEVGLFSDEIIQKGLFDEN